MSEKKTRGAGPGLLCSVAGMGLLIVFAGGCDRGKGPIPTVRVVSCQRTGAATRAGLELGDGVFAWKCGERNGTVHSPFDLWRVELMEALECRVTLHVLRNGVERDVVVGDGRWRVSWRLELPGSAGEALAGAEFLWKENRDHEAAAAFAGLAGDQEVPPRARAWLWLMAGVADAAGGDLGAAGSDLDRAAALAGGVRARSLAGLTAARLLEEAGRKARARQLYQAVATACRGGANDERLLAQALLGVAACTLRGDAEAAGEALELYQKIRPGSLAMAEALLQLGISAYFEERFEDAEHRFLQGLEIARRRDPTGGEALRFLANIGLVRMRRGDLEGARVTCLEALEAARRFDPGGKTEAYTLNFLGLVAKGMGRLEEARAWYERALTAFRTLRPKSREVAGVLNNLGNIANREQDFGAAERYHREAFRLRKTLGLEADSAASLNNLGLVAYHRGELEQARRFLERAVILKRRLAPGTLWLASSLNGLGDVALRQGRLDEAERLYGEALEIRHRVLPGGIAEAEALAGLGEVAEAQGRTAEAGALWKKALELIESHRRRVGLSEEERSDFGAMFHWISVRVAGLLAEEGRIEAAFHLVEQERARALRAAVGQRLPETLPGELRAAWRQHRRAVRSLLRRLATTGPSAGKDHLAVLRDRLAALDVESHRLIARIRKTDPRFAALLEQPATPTLRQVGTVLGPGTVLLEYGVCDRGTLLLAVGGDGTSEGHWIGLPGQELARRVDRFLALIGRGEHTAEIEQALTVQSRELAEILIGPVGRMVAKAGRVVVVPDGPLSRLPFAALQMPGGRGRAWLGCRRGLSRVASASVLVDLERCPRVADRGDGKVVVFSVPEPEAGMARRYGLEPLPWAKAEAATLASLFPERAVVYEGGAATPDALRGAVGGAWLLHFAAHAVEDRRNPLDSALFLAPPHPGVGDGRLTAWKIMQDLRVEADLVTLSACSTACGREVPGEGVLGLSRAFHYAGARVVLATLWRVPDRSACLLMEGFYTDLKDGLPADEALRRARCRLMERPGAALGQPYHWAGFTLIGGVGERR